MDSLFRISMVEHPAEAKRPDHNQALFLLGLLLLSGGEAVVRLRILMLPNLDHREHEYDQCDQAEDAEKDGYPATGWPRSAAVRTTPGVFGQRLHASQTPHLMRRSRLWRLTHL